MMEQEQKSLFEKYLALWTKFYSTRTPGGDVAIAARYAAMDNMNEIKQYNDQASIDDHLAYWTKKIG
jgi:hypothetical protein